jgi:hypothetical protein
MGFGTPTEDFGTPFMGFKTPLMHFGTLSIQFYAVGTAKNYDKTMIPKLLK